MSPPSRTNLPKTGEEKIEDNKAALSKTSKKRTSITLRRLMSKIQVPSRFNRLLSAGSIDSSMDGRRLDLLSRAALLNAEAETRRAELELKKIEPEHT